MWSSIKILTVSIVLRVVHAALIELRALDSRVAKEFERFPEGLSYSIRTGFEGPTLHVLWQDGELKRVENLPAPVCSLRIKSMPLSFQLFTGQMGMAQAYARHAFTMAGEVADVMRLARLVNLVEAYLFPKIMTRRIMTDVPETEVCFLRAYARIAWGFLTCKYKLSK
ncbi:MAG: hypothetical protein IJ985_08425 [Akkermansia sp.]|nr:hypothetical protein [Akkermansia sp.]